MGCKICPPKPFEEDSESIPAPEPTPKPTPEHVKDKVDKPDKLRRQSIVKSRPEEPPEPPVEGSIADVVEEPVKPNDRKRVKSRPEEPPEPPVEGSVADVVEEPVKPKRPKRDKPEPEKPVESISEESVVIETEESSEKTIEEFVKTKIGDEFDSKPSTVPDRLVDIVVADADAFNQALIQQRQAAVSKTSYRSTIESWQPNSLEELADTLKALSKGKATVDRYWLIFYWVAINIEYDTVSYFSKNYADQTAEGVFRTRKGVCAGYANIYKYLCDALQMPCEVVGGYSKGYGFDDREGAPTETDHAWNVVQIHSHWYLVESTWAAGHLNDEKRFVRELNAYYFLARADEMIYHHLPEDEKWQLLQTPVKMQQYMQMPKLRPLYFEFKLNTLQPRNQCFVNLERDQSFALVVMKAPSDVYLIADLKLHDQKVEGGFSVVFDKKKRVYNCFFAPASTGKHKITIYARRGDTDIGSFSAVLDLVLQINQMPRNPVSYPKTWKTFYDLGMKLISPLNTHLISLSDGEKFAQIIIHARADVELMGQLEDEQEKTVSCGDQVYYDREKDYWRCRFAPDRSGTVNALILAKRKTDAGVYQSAISFKIRAKRIRSPAFSFAKTWQRFYDFDLELLSPVGQGTLAVNDDTPTVEVRMKAPDGVALLGGLVNENDKKITDGGKIYYDRDNDLWRCTFAPDREGMFKGSIYVKKTSDPGEYFSAISFILDARQLSSQHVSLLDTTQLFHDLKLEVLSPNGGSKIVLSERASFVEICIKTPRDVELVAQLKTARGREIPGGDEVCYDRRKDIWRCRFAPNGNGVFDAIILAKKKSDGGMYSSVVTYHLEAMHVRSPPLSFPKTWQLFHDLDLKIKAPRDRSTAVWPDNASYSEVLIQAPDDVELSCQMEYEGETVENGAFAQYNDEKDLWQLLFAPEQTGEHELVVFGRRVDDTNTSANSVVTFSLDVTHLRQPMKFPFTYTEFTTSRCRIYTPLEGRLKKGSVVNFQCRIPNATDVTMMVDSTMLRAGGYSDPIFQREITVGSSDVAICAKYGQTPNYNVLIKYTVEKNA